MRWLSGFFVLSGFCSLVYQVVWLRAAMAQFGVTTTLVSIVLSVFMAGLALGSWGAGRLERRHPGLSGRGWLRLYGLAELLIGVAGVLAAPALRWGRQLLSISGGGLGWESWSYTLASGAWVALVLLPFCACMGATFPLAMAAIRARSPESSPRSFSRLYAANLLGAIAGTLGSAFALIEALGFRGTVLLAASLNGLIAAGAWLLRWPGEPSARATPAPRAGELPRTGFSGEASRSLALPLLFTTGFTTLGMEVVWTRQFVAFQGTVVYAFASILALYLAGTALGTAVYRRAERRRGAAPDLSTLRAASILAGGSSLLPLLAADPRLPLPDGVAFGAVRVALGLLPFCGVLGWLTPLLVDRWSGGDPARAGSAYALNGLGCILGPVVSGFVLLPLVGERASLVLLSLPLFAFVPLAAWRDRGRAKDRAARPFPGGERWMLAATGALSILLVARTADYQTLYPAGIVKRDPTATVIATGEGMGKRMLVNGVGITHLTPITKMMAHLPLALLDRKPEAGLVLCFGMGTSFRSMLSWGISTTAVELVPSVPELFGFYHPDAESLRRAPLGRIVIDDARRFLERSEESYDVITVDPPPPVEAAGSSLLYSVEFYEAAGRRLRPGGILAQWLPPCEPAVVVSVARSLARSFPHLRTFTSMEGWGGHLLASREEIPVKTAAELAKRLPPAAAQDLLEWGPGPTVEAQLDRVLGREYSPRLLVDAPLDIPALSDDRPVNEYFLLRRTFGRDVGAVARR